MPTTKTLTNAQRIRILDMLVIPYATGLLALASMRGLRASGLQQADYAYVVGMGWCLLSCLAWVKQAFLDDVERTTRTVMPTTFICVCAAACLLMYWADRSVSLPMWGWYLHTAFWLGALIAYGRYRRKWRVALPVARSLA